MSVNGAAIPQALIGSELFGHEKGAFTGVTQRRLGRFALVLGQGLARPELGRVTLLLGFGAGQVDHPSLRLLRDDRRARAMVGVFQRRLQSQRQASVDPLADAVAPHVQPPPNLGNGLTGMITPEDLSSLYLTPRRCPRLTELLELVHFLGCQNQSRAFGFSCHTKSMAETSSISSCFNETNRYMMYRMPHTMTRRGLVNIGRSVSCGRRRIDGSF